MGAVGRATTEVPFAEAEIDDDSGGVRQMGRQAAAA